MPDTLPTTVPQPRPAMPNYEGLFLEPAYVGGVGYQEHDDGNADEPIGSASAA
ncbi:hypothetical protein Srufu_079170 (plasmid) [Streptomyces libani subsp. rufus]|nr:hypothetical protein Srufu_079170 [Streptomyces libani subsp. rufus]